MSLRDNRIAAESVGISVTKYKLIAFSLSAFFAGIAGVLYSHNLSVLAATSKNFGYNMSIMIACVLTALPEVLRGLRDYRMLIYAVVLIVMMIMTSSPKAIAFWETHSIKKFFKKGNGKTKKEAR